MSTPRVKGMSPVVQALEAKRSRDLGVSQQEFARMLQEIGERQAEERGIEAPRLTFDGYRSWLRRRDKGVRDGIDNHVWDPVIAEMLEISIPTVAAIRFSNEFPPEKLGIDPLPQTPNALGGGQLVGNPMIDRVLTTAVLQQALTGLGRPNESDKVAQLEREIHEMRDLQAEENARIMGLLESIVEKTAKLTAVKSEVAAKRSRTPARAR